MTGIEIREERPGDEAAIRLLVERAFEGHPYSAGDEATVIDRLRADGDLALSLVACDGDAIVGHAAYSEARLSDGCTGWMVVGPIAVDPSQQRRGIGRTLIEQGEAVIRNRGAKGVTVLGDPSVYGRFGFASGTSMRLEGELGQYLQVKSFGAPIPTATITYAPAFG